MNLRTTLLAATVLAAPALLAHKAAAQPVTGPYVSLGGGYTTEDQQKVKNIVVNGVQRPYEARVGIKNGFAGNGAIGYGFGNGFRVEIEGDYLGNRFDEYKADGGDVPVHGTQQQYGAFANVLYDFDLGIPYAFPYVGAGAGWQYDYFNGFSTPGGTFIDKNKGAVAYQGIAGIAVPVPMVPGLSLTADYRFVGLAGSRKYNGVNANGLPFQFKALHEYNNVFEGGLRYVLFQPVPMAPAPTPAPAPMAAPAPAPAKTYLVFFDWDKYNLTPRATQIIAQAASDSKTQSTTTIDVSGYTDTSGTVVYNQGLSERRAKAVAAQLVSDGVSESEISIHAYGETHLLVPTGPGVREPQNRRVEIVLQ